MYHVRGRIFAEPGRGLLRLVRGVGVISSLLLSSIAGHAAPADAKARIAFVGDSLAQNYWAGVVRLVAKTLGRNDEHEPGEHACGNLIGDALLESRYDRERARPLPL